MAYQVWKKNDVVVGFVYGPQQNGSEPAPDGFSPDNAREWIKKDGEWVRDSEEAKTKREELKKDDSE